MPDMAALTEILKDGRTTARSAVERLTKEKYGKAVAEHKQARAARPTTPGNQSTRENRYKPGMSMVEIMKADGLLK
jgi:hypothetical protein